MAASSHPRSSYSPSFRHVVIEVKPPTPSNHGHSRHVSSRLLSSPSSSIRASKVPNAVGATVPGWQPLSPPGSQPIPVASLLHQVRSFLLEDRSAIVGNLVSVHRKFHHVSEAAYRDIARTLSYMRQRFVDYPKGARINYFSDLSLLVITFPSELHEILGQGYQYYVRQTLYENGFYWPTWGDNIGHIYARGAADMELIGRSKGTSKMQPDGSLRIQKLAQPFLIIEVADSETFKDALMKTHRYLMESRGAVRFVILINLVKKTLKEKRQDRHRSESQQECGHSSEQENISDPESGDAVAAVSENQTIGSNKRPTDEEYGRAPKKSRADSEASLSSPPVPSSPPQVEFSNPPDSPEPTLPRNLRTIYTRATITIKTSRLFPDAQDPRVKRRKIVTLINAIEFWPTPAPEDAAFTFTWEDMNVQKYPEELREKVFSIGFMWLHEQVAALVEEAEEDGDEISMVMDGDEVLHGYHEETSGENYEYAMGGEMSSGKVESDENYGE